MKRVLGISLLIFYTLTTWAQNASDEIEIADGMRESGKIYVVIAVLVIIFLGLASYMAMIDRKLSKMEKEINKQ